MLGHRVLGIALVLMGMAVLFLALNVQWKEAPQILGLYMTGALSVFLIGLGIFWLTRKNHQPEQLKRVA